MDAPIGQTHRPCCSSAAQVIDKHVMSSTLIRYGLLGGVAASALAAGVIYDRRPPARHAQLPVAAETAPSPVTPSFDVVRVSGTGGAVLAGRAEPQSTVSIRDNGAEIGQVHADARGEWVFMPTVPLDPGAQQLTLAASIGHGRETQSVGEVLLVVPDRSAPAPNFDGKPATPAEPAIAVLSLPAAPSRVLQSAAPTGRVTLDVVDYDAQGQIRFTGAGPASTPVRIYVDNSVVGDAQTDAQGRWTLEPSGPVRPGVHALRVDQVGPRGQVVSRVEMPFQRADLPTLEPGRVVVQPGENLWRLARQAYGAGIRYTVIYRANQDQIRDPRRIYPGQAFTIPGGS